MRKTLPAKSPSVMVAMRFSCISSFFKFSSKARAFCGTAVKSLPPRFSRFSFLKQRNSMFFSIRVIFVALRFIAIFLNVLCRRKKRTILCFLFVFIISGKFHRFLPSNRTMYNGHFDDRFFAVLSLFIIVYLKAAHHGLRFVIAI